ncbi:MAG TPA: His-Xaa-Ser system radical SAM maturase HxsC [Syntrophales bacterium]|nr:His-Xaa-Ser system radical SAM maturase HxsC [Syntrophales bacterium]
MFYSAIITSLKNVSESGMRSPCIYGIDGSDLRKLQDGDVVLLEPNGSINMLYEIHAYDNALLATERCNCRCIMCPQPPRSDKPGLQELNMKLIKLMDRKNTRSLCITGGEPTLLDAGFIRLVEECKERLPDTPLAVLTNGKNFQEFEFTKGVVNVGHPDITFCIALYADEDNLHDDIVGVPGSFYQTIKGITNLARFNQKIEIRNVISALNYKRLRQSSEFIYRNFPFSVHVALMGMEITGRALENISQVWIDPIDYISDLREAVKVLARAGMNVSIYNLPLCLLPKELWRYSRRSISSWKNKYISECNSCKERDNCAGFFGTSGNFISKGILALT